MKRGLSTGRRLESIRLLAHLYPGGAASTGTTGHDPRSHKTRIAGASQREAYASDAPSDALSMSMTKKAAFDAARLGRRARFAGVETVSLAAEGGRDTGRRVDTCTFRVCDADHAGPTVLKAGCRRVG